MIEGRVIVCVASSWDYDPTSKHHLMKILSRRNRIVWVNYHGTRRPALTTTDARTACRALLRAFRGIRRVGSSFVQTTPLVIPGATHPILVKLHQRMLASQIRRAVRSVDPGSNMPLQVWSFAPDVPYLVGEFNEECFVYYCVDEHSQFDGVDSGRIASAERELAGRADLLVTSSRPLMESKRAIRPDVILLRHGVDYDHFASAWRSKLDAPEDLKSTRRPILGFFGVIHYWIDVALIAEVARLRPEYSFVLIGERLVDTSPLERLNNVHMLGRRPNSMLPAYCAQFSAGLMPFKQTALTHNINPIKMFEYLASGLPVVSTSIPEARRYDGPVTIADSAEGFAAACDRCVQEDDPLRRECISDVVSEESWESRVETLSTMIEERVLRYESPCAARKPSRRSCAGVL